MRFTNPEEKNINSRTALYIDGAMEFQVINLVNEYGVKLRGMSYAVASRHTEIELKVMYGDKLQEFSPFLYMTERQGEAILESQRNNDFYAKKDLRKHEVFDYDEELTATHCKRILSRGQFHLDPESVLLANIDKENYEAWRADALKRIYKAMEKLTELQLRRFIKHFVLNKSTRQIAEEENVDVKSVYQSINGAIKKIQKNV